MCGSTLSQESTPEVRKQKEIPKEKDDGFQKQDDRVKGNVKPFPLNHYILIPKVNEIDLIDSFKSKFSSQFIGSSLNNVFQTNV